MKALLRDVSGPLNVLAASMSLMALVAILLVPRDSTGLYFAILAVVIWTVAFTSYLVGTKKVENG